MPSAAPEHLVARCLHWNQRGNTTRVRWALSLIAFLLSLTALSFSTSRNPGFNAAPPMGGDAVSYDSLGWELAAGRGFALDFRDPAFLEPYRSSDPPGADQLAQAALHGPIASRPPLLPLVLAGLNRTLGRQFYGLRTINVFVMSIVAALLVWTVCRLAGPIPALMALLNFLIVDPRIRVTAREFLTEALACFLMTILTMLLVRIARRPRLNESLIAGAVFGAAMLLRTMFVLWTPVLLVLLWLSPRFARNNASQPAELLSDGHPPLNRRAVKGVQLGAVFLAAATVVFAPWAIRNCRILGRILPLGTQGMMELSAGHGNTAFDRWGMWHNLEETGFFATVDQPGQSALQRELARADWSWRQAVAWRRDNSGKVIVLPLMKVFQEFRPHMSGDLYVLAFALLGLCSLRGSAEARVWSAMILATALGVAVTWSVAGRFIVPILYILHAAAAIGLWQSLLACTVERRPASPAARR